MRYQAVSRGLRNLALATLIVLALGTCTWAQSPTLSLGTVTVTSGSTGVASNTFNDTPAVCAGNESHGLDLSAGYTATFDSNSTTLGTLSACTACANAAFCTTGNHYKSQTSTTVTVTNKSVAITFTDDFNNTTTLSGNSSPLTGTLALSGLTSNGYITVNVSGKSQEDYATETDTTYHLWSGNCSGTATATNTVTGTPSSGTYYSNAATTTEYYYLDVNPPTMTHSVTYNPLTQGNNQTHTTVVSGGASGKKYDLWAEAVGPGPTTLGPATSNGHTFGTNSATGIAPDATDTEVLTLNTYCPGTPTGTYADTAKVTPTDLCGNVLTAVNSSSNPVDFDIIAPSGEFLVQADVFAPLGGPNYTSVQCYTSSLSTTGKGKNKNGVLAIPGTLHAAAVLTNSSGCGGGGGTNATGVTISITIPNDFDFDMNGKSPAVHVCGGPIADFDAATCAPLVGVPFRSVTENPSGRTVTISGIDLGDGPGVLEAGKMIYALAHVRLTDSATSPSNANLMDWLEEFQAQASANEFTTSTSNTSPFVIQNPSNGGEICVNGLLNPPPN